MSLPKIESVCRADLFTSEAELNEKYDAITVAKLLRLRGEYQWVLANPDAKDREFLEEMTLRYGLTARALYGDLQLVKTLLPALSSSSRAYHRWKMNQMLLETYQMAKKRKDTKTMERAATSYGKLNRVDMEDEQVMPYDDIVVQPFTATDDPRVLGIEPIPNLEQVIKDTITKYSKESREIEDVSWEEADLELEELFPKENANDGKAEETNLL